MKRNSSVPYVIEKRSDGERVYDIYSRLLEDRIIFIGQEITTELANNVIAQLLLLDKSPQDIYIYINSPGGEVMAGLAILDTINYIKAPVRTVCVGCAASMAAVLLSSGKKGQRFALPNSKIMIHQPRQRGTPDIMTVTEQEIDLKVSKRMKEQLSQILAENTGKSLKHIKRDCELDKWLEPEEALEYGLIDSILAKKPNT